MIKLKDFCSENTADIDIPVSVIMTICRHFYVKKTIYLAHINPSDAQNSRSESKQLAISKYSSRSYLSCSRKIKLLLQKIYYLTSVSVVSE